MANWRTNPAVRAASTDTRWHHIRRTNPNSPSNQSELFATIATIPIKIRDKQYFAVGLAVKGPGDSASKSIGRQMSEGRALRTVAEEYGIVELPESGRKATREILSPEQFDVFLALTTAMPNNILAHMNTAIVSQAMSENA